MPRPVKEWRCGSVRVQMFSNETATERQGYPVFSFRVERRYKDKKGDWHSSPSLFKRDLLDLAELCHAAYQQLSVKEQNLADGKDEPEPEQP